MESETSVMQNIENYQTPLIYQPIGPGPEHHVILVYSIPARSFPGPNCPPLYYRIFEKLCCVLQV